MELGKWADDRRPKLAAITKGEPASESERRLSNLIDSTFLKLWSFPNLYTDKRGHSSGDGKEFCDHLVVFGDQAIIFSDKEIGWKEAKTLDVSWRRWQRAAVHESLKQAMGAWRWLISYPERIFLDRRCKQPFFLDGFAADRSKVHLISVVSGAEEACSVEDPESKGEMRVGWGSNNECEAFTLNSTRVEATPTHVLDITGLSQIAHEFDTAADFLKYLDWRICFLEEHQYFCGTESDLLTAFFTLNYIANDLVASADFSLIILDDYSSIRQRAEYIRKTEANKISYLWDAIIDDVSSQVLGGTVLGTPGQNQFSFYEAERGLRFLAAADRFKRRTLSESLVDSLSILGKQKGDHFFRAILKEGMGGLSESTFAILLVNAGRDGRRLFESYEQFRVYRAALLRVYCQGLALRNSSAQPIVGVGLDGCDMGGITPAGGVDIAVFDKIVFDVSSIEAQERLEKSFDIFSNVSWNLQQSQEFPEKQPGRVTRQQRRARERRAKKGRSWPLTPATS